MEDLGIYIFLSLLFAAGLAFIPANIAKSKGKDFGTWYIYGFLLFIVALIHAASLPYPQQQQVVYVPAGSDGESYKEEPKVTVGNESVDYYDINAPIDIVNVTLNKNERTNQVFLELTLVSYFDSTIKALKLDISCYNAFGEPIGVNNVFHAVVQDLNIEPKVKIELKPIELLGFGEARAVKIVFTQAMLTSENWSNPGPIIVSEANKWTGTDLENSRFVFGNNAEYKPEETTYGWNCTCGRPNKATSNICVRCGNEKTAALKVTSEYIQLLASEKKEENRQAWLRSEQARIKAEEDRLFEDQRRLEAERQRLITVAKHKKQIQLAIIVTLIAATVVTGYILLSNYVIIPASKYSKAQDLLANKQYDKAIALFAELGRYKDSANQKLNSETQRLDSKYVKAQELLLNKQYDEAIALFTELGAYKDSAKQIQITKLKILENTRVGDLIYWGQYEQDNNSANGKEDIAWNVLAISDGKALLISEKNLDCQPYNKSNESVTWETCTLRRWLNTTFLSEAFTAGDQIRIIKTDLINNDNPDYGTPGGNSTKDTIFLLSIEEVNRYFSDNPARFDANTPYAVSRGANDVGGTGSWWLRSLGGSDSNAASVLNFGDVLENGDTVNADDVAVRPAFWINLKS